jgi:hypothetical protein
MRRRSLVLLVLAAACASACGCAEPVKPLKSRISVAGQAARPRLPQADDASYLRRVTLDLAGRIPRPDEVRAYLADRDPQKKEKLVDRLLASDDHAQHWADVLGELLIGLEVRPPVIGERFRAWLVQSIREGKGWDRMVREMLTASGDLETTSAGLFLLATARKGGGTEAAAGATARIFLGLQLQCAQCHDHPYDERWKQEDFHGLAAYFERTRARKRAIFDGFRARPHRMKRPSGEEVVVEPRFLGREVGPGTRQVLAQAVIGSDLFAKAQVGFIWSRMFGAGLVEPWNDLGAEHDRKHPAELERLARDFAAAGYDHRKLLRGIALSEAYGARERPLRPLGPAALFRSLVVATGLSERQEEAPERFRRALREYLFVFGDDEGEGVDRSGNVPQALLLRNGELTHRGAKVLARRARGARDPLEELFLATLSRPPTGAERALTPTDVAGWEDLAHALLNTTEFGSNH